MANKLPSSSGYFNREMLAILKKGEEKKPENTKKTVKRTTKKK